MSKAMIQIRQLVKEYDTVTALKGVSFDVRSGEILGLLGPNGAGKSTTMKILTSYISATAGQVTIDGLDLFQNPIETRQLIGYLPESTAIYPDMVVWDYLVYCGEMRGFTKAQCHKRIEELAGRVGIIEKLKEPIHTLSKGYKQRVGLAQALLHKPKIVILDEPTSGLDPNQIVEIRDLIKELGKDHTVILSTHILPEVRQTCDRIVIIHQGEKAADGTIEQLEGKLNNSHELIVGIAYDGNDRGEPIRQELAKLSGIKSVRHSHGAQEPVAHEVFILDAKRDLRTDIATWTQSKGYTLVELRRTSLDLEAIFQRITAEA